MKKMKKIILISSLTFLMTASGLSWAIQKPAGLVTDRRIKMVEYDPNNVVQVNTHYGFTTTIELAEDEEVTLNPVIGKSAGWQVLSQKNYIYLKPMADADVDDTTDLNVVTNKHTYNFLLYATSAKDTSSSQTFMIKFKYPEDNLKSMLGSSEATYNLIDHFGNPEEVNQEYSFKGDRTIAPIKAEDNGKFTLLLFKKGTPIPAILAVDFGGKESQVNFRLQGDYVVIEGVYQQYTLRYGPHVVCLFNDKALDDWKRI